jgi:hypothetical protein
MKKNIFVNRLLLLKKNHSVSIIDILGVGIFIFIIAAIFLLFPRKKEEITILLDVTKYVSIDRSDVENWNTPAFWFTESIQKNPLVKSNVLGKNEIEVTNVIFPDNAGEENKRVFLEIRLVSTFNKQTGQYSYNGVPLLIGSAQRFKFNRIMINGVVRDVYNSENNKQNEMYITVRVQLDPLYYPPFSSSEQIINPIGIDPTTLDGIPTYISEKIRNNLSVKNDKGKMLAEITNVQKVEATRKIISNGQLIRILDENREKVELTLKILVRKYNDNYYFLEHYPVLIGRNIKVNFQTLPLLLTVTDISE